MTDFTPVELNQIEELNKVLLPASGLTEEQLLARLDRMSIEQVIEDAHERAIEVPKAANANVSVARFDRRR